MSACYSAPAEQPLFAKWQKEQAERTVLAPDGKTKHKLWAQVLTEARTPSNKSNADTTDLVIDIAQAMATAGLQKMHDPKLAIAEMLESQGGACAPGTARAAVVHEATKGAHTTNDRVESNFGCLDYVLRCFESISVEAASAVAQQMRMHHFEQGDRCKRKAPDAARRKGFFYTLPEAVQEAIIEAARQLRAESRKWAHADRAEQLEYKKVKKAENQQKQLEVLVDKSATAMEYFTLWKSRGVANAAVLSAKLARLESEERGNSEAKRRDFLQEQISMRVLGLGWEKFKMAWSKQGKKVPLESLVSRLKEILIEEAAERRLLRLPTEAAVPLMKPKSVKQLGTITCDASELASAALFSPAQVQAAAAAERTRREQVGLVDAVQDLQGEMPAPSSLKGKWIEVCWKYKNTDTGEPVLIWCAGEVIDVADGVTTKASSRSNARVLAANTVLIRWAADADYEEEESQAWFVLQPGKWNGDVQNSWRLDPRELKRTPGARACARQTPRPHARS